MGKIENVFPSREEGQMFAMNAYGQILLRISIGESLEYTPDIVVDVAAGIGASYALDETIDDFTEPMFNLQPFSHAHLRVHGQTLESEIRDKVEVNVVPERHLRIENPVVSIEKVRSVLDHMIGQKRGSLTVAQAFTVGEVCRGLKDLRKIPQAQAAYVTARAALAEIW